MHFKYLSFSHSEKIRGGGGSDEVWDRETMFSQLAKAVNPRASQRSSKAAICFLMVSTLALSVG